LDNHPLQGSITKWINQIRINPKNIFIVVLEVIIESSPFRQWITINITQNHKATQFIVDMNIDPYNDLQYDSKNIFWVYSDLVDPFRYGFLKWMVVGQPYTWLRVLYKIRTYIAWPIEVDGSLLKEKWGASRNSRKCHTPTCFMIKKTSWPHPFSNRGNVEPHMLSFWICTLFVIKVVIIYEKIVIDYNRKR